MLSKAQCAVKVELSPEITYSWIMITSESARAKAPVSQSFSSDDNHYRMLVLIPKSTYSEALAGNQITD
jgi:hypothetical protein